jgi:cytochrome c biogenesis protein
MTKPFCFDILYSTAMSVAEQTLESREIPKRKTVPILNRVLDFISSVRLAYRLLITLVVLSMIGMLIIQQNVQGFDTYFASLTPAERLVYGRLGIFDIYHSWYFNILLLVLSLNIVLASIDRFPPHGAIL